MLGKVTILDKQTLSAFPSLQSCNWISLEKNTQSCLVLLYIQGCKAQWVLEMVRVREWSCSVVSDSLWPHGPGSSVHGIFQARILEWVAISLVRLLNYPSPVPSLLTHLAGLSPTFSALLPCLHSQGESLFYWEDWSNQRRMSRSPHPSYLPTNTHIHTLRFLACSH